jgi:hypothetical protein
MDGYMVRFTTPTRGKAGSMNDAVIEAIYRYPVKGPSPDRPPGAIDAVPSARA